MDLFLASKPDQMSPDGKEHVIRTLSRIRDIGQEIHDRGGLAAMAHTQCLKMGCHAI